MGVETSSTQASLSAVMVPRCSSKGLELLRNPALNKGTAFTTAERDACSLRGLLPPRIMSQEQQVQRVLENLRRKPNHIEKYLFLIELQDRNERLFYRVVLDHLEEVMPLIYTPTVGQACQEYAHIFRRPRGLYLSTNDRGRISECLANWPERDIKVIVVTDGERILGLGDLGINGIGIPVGKLALYTAGAGIPPRNCLPVVIDVGTNNETLLNDPLYLGIPEHRLRGSNYHSFLDEFIRSVTTSFPHAVIQFEDFANPNALQLLAKYRDRIRCFNDDIQGTAAVVLAGLYSAVRLIGTRLSEQRLLICGAGGAGVGIGLLFAQALQSQGLPIDEARSRCWYVDSTGLLTAERTSLNEFQRLFAHKGPSMHDLLEIIEHIRPTALIGVSGAAGIFTQPVIEGLARINERPIIFALSNPTACAECTAEQAYRWTDGRAAFASGSPFPDVNYQHRTYAPGQANNVYIFPGLGLGVSCSGATRITDAMFLGAAKALAAEVTEADLTAGRLYPPLSRLREVSFNIAVAVAEEAYRSNLAQQDPPPSIPASIRRQMYNPNYPNLLDEFQPV